jgi:hypothetical protein
MTWHQIVGHKGPSNALDASVPQGLETSYYLHLHTSYKILAATSSYPHLQ